MEHLSLFTERFAQISSKPIKNIHLNQQEAAETAGEPHQEIIQSDNLSCSYCKTIFESKEQQRIHYKLDWHRYNLSHSKAPLSEEVFLGLDTDDLSSISGSESEDENDDGVIFSLFRPVLLMRKEDASEAELWTRLKTCLSNQKWSVLMVGGGHFAGAVFEGGEATLHKTFHCYTVRAGQGGAQSSRDNKGGASKSAGSSLRRYNEQALVQHVQQVLEAWKLQIAACSLVFYRASGPYNRQVLFGNPGILLKDDGRLRTIPFPTRRATFKEVQRVHGLLSTAQIYSSLSHAQGSIQPQKTPPEAQSKRSKTHNSSINRAKSREIQERPLPCQNSESQSDCSDFELETNMEEISFESLKEHASSIPKKRKPKTKKKKAEVQLLNRLKACEKGNLIELKSLFSNFKHEQSDLLDDIQTKVKFFNEIIDKNGNTCLHVASKTEQIDLIKFLLEHEANPTIKNKNHETAYVLTNNAEIREVFRQFSRDFPDKFNYNKANIPVNALTNQELADKKREQRKFKREKDKERKKNNEIKRREQQERDRFLALSDREKRALAAERRNQVLQRCFGCAADITGKIPFEYLSNTFCTIECLKSHRMKNLSLSMS